MSSPSPSHSVSLFLRVLPLFSPFSMSPRHCVSDIMNHMLLLWSVDCALPARNGKGSKEGSTLKTVHLAFCSIFSFFFLFFFAKIHPLPLSIPALIIYSPISVHLVDFSMFSCFARYLVSLLQFVVCRRFHVLNSKRVSGPFCTFEKEMQRTGLVPCPNHCRGQ